MNQPLRVFLEHFSIAWRQCVRANGLVGVLILGIAVLASAGLFAAFSIRQPLVVAMDLGISGIKILGAFLMLFWVQECFVRDIERRTILAMFAYPAPRSTYVIGRFFGVAAVSACAIAFWGAGLASLGLFADWGYAESSRPIVNENLCLILAGTWLDLVTIGAFMLLMVSVTETRFLPLFLGVGFTLAARGIGPMVDYLRLSADADPDLRKQVLPLLETISWILPDLSRLDWREIALYGAWPDAFGLLMAAAQSGAYIALLVSTAVLVYQYREFS